MDALKEAFSVTKPRRTPLILSHLKCAGVSNWGRAGETLELITDEKSSSVTARPSTAVTIAAGGEARVDWRVKAVAPGEATEGLKQAILVISVIAPVGLALGWLYLKRGLIAAIAGHAAFNLLGVLLPYLAQNLPGPGTGS